MINELIQQIKEKVYNENMLFSLYNIIDDDGSLIQLSNNNNYERYCVDDFEWIKLEIESNTSDSSLNKLYNDLKLYTENEMKGTEKGLFIVLKERNIYCVKLRNLIF